MSTVQATFEDSEGADDLSLSAEQIARYSTVQYSTVQYRAGQDMSA